MREVPPSPAVRSLGRGFFRLRPVIAAGASLVVLCAFWLGEVPRAQFLLVLVGFAAAVSTFTWEAMRAEQIATGVRPLRWSLIRTLAFLSMGCVATGGFLSPLLPMLLAPLAALLLVLHPVEGRRPVLVSFALVAGVLAFATVAPPFPRLESATHAVSAGAAWIAAALLISAILTGYTLESEAIERALGAAREALVEQIRERSAALEQVGARLSHELRNPLSAIRGLVELELAQAEHEKSRRRLEVVREEIARIDGLVGEYLSFTRGSAPLRLETVDPGAIARELQVLLQPQIARRNLELQIDVHFSGSAWADRARLKEALLNLLLNAIDATPDGGVVSLQSETRASSLLLRVRDSGVGLTPEVLARLGTPFFTTRENGTGLGVAIARGIAERHGGELTYESAPGRGTVAELRLPTTTPESTAA